MIQTIRNAWAVPEPVSYTHLDVYKRQIMTGPDADILPGNCLPIAKRCKALNLSPAAMGLSLIHI